MEEGKPNYLAKEDATEIVPSQIITTANEVAGIVCVVHHDQLNAGFHPSDSSATGTEEAAIEGQNSLSKLRAAHSVSVSMPAYPLGVHLENTKEVSFGNNAEANSSNYIPNSAAISKNSNIPTKFYSRSVPKGSVFNENISNGTIPKPFNLKLRNPNIDKPKNSPFNSFRTWSKKFERQISNLHGKHWETVPGIDLQPAEVEALSVDRYFDALEGPELDTLRASEEVLLPEDKTWPFLLRYPISSFSICLGISSQAIMWKTLATSTSTKFLHVSPDINLVLWCTSVALVAIVFFIYSLKVIFYFEAVRREYYHPIRINFFFAPWIALLFLALGVPPSICQNLHKSLWYILMTPIVCLEIKIYGQWMSGGQRRLSRVANPSNHLSVVGNFVGALLGASMGLKEGPVFFFAIGLAHYTVLFVTLYQRLPTYETLPKELHPVFFLFVAAPSVASMAWAKIQGSFDYGSRISYFIALFLYFSLAIRLNFFRGFRFSLAWWAYTFPMTGAAIATIRYSNVVKNVVTKTLTVFLCSVSTLTVGALLVTTIIHAFVLRDLFSNDIAIAISERRIESTPRWYHRRGGSSDMKDIEQYLKYRNSDDKDNNASLKPPSLSDQDASPCSR